MSRPKGSKNKATLDFKEAVTRLLKRQSLQSLLDEVSPDKRLDVICKLAEYAFPKLGRTEVSGPEGGPVKVIEIVRET
jgi:hypothetical protein